MKIRFWYIDANNDGSINISEPSGQWNIYLLPSSHSQQLGRFFQDFALHNLASQLLHFVHDLRNPNP